MNKLILWDIDGTLLQTKPGYDNLSEEEFMKAASKATGRSDLCPPDNIHGSTDFAIVHEILCNSDYSREEASRLIFQVFSELDRATSSPSYIEKTRQKTAGVSNVLRTLATNNIQTYGTGNLPFRAQAKVGFFEIDQYLDPEIGGFGFWTRSRAEFLLYAQRLATSKYQKDFQAVVIGDTPADIAGARAAGFQSVAVAGGHYSEEELVEADLVLPDFGDPEPLEEFLQGRSFAISTFLSRTIR